MTAIDPALVSFYRQHEAFPTLSDEDHTIMVNVTPNGPREGGNYEFSVVHVGTGGRSRQPLGLQVCIFDDAWRAYADLPEFFALLAASDRSDLDHLPAPMDLNDLSERLRALGWSDRTPEYAEQHEHVIGCLLCGQRHEEGTR